MSYADHVPSDFIAPDTAKLGECEFWLISQINAQLIIHHPYRKLNELQSKLDLSQDEMSLAWSIVNDHYVTDLPLRYPPNIIATMAVVMTLTMRPGQGKQSASLGQSGAAGRLAGGQPSPASLAQAVQSKGDRLKDWLAQSKTDINALVDCTQHMISLYVLLEGHTEKDCREQVARFAKDAEQRSQR